MARSVASFISLELKDMAAAVICGIRNLTALTASHGLNENEIGCAWVFMMARERKAPFKGAVYRNARPNVSKSSHQVAVAPWREHAQN